MDDLETSINDCFASHSVVNAQIQRDTDFADEPPVRPNADIRHPSSTYFIDMELSGVSDKESVSLEWTSSRDVIVSGTISRRCVSDFPRPEIKENVGNLGAQDRMILHAPGTQAPELKPATVERRIRVFRRHFCFPVEVDMVGLEAKLEAGLLMIWVPKKVGAAQRGKVNIE